MTKHSPAPWTDSLKADGTGRHVIHDRVGVLVAVVPHAGNARLIAAVPQQHNALKAAPEPPVGLTTIEQFDRWMRMYDAWYLDMREQAIRAAEGSDNVG